MYLVCPPALNLTWLAYSPLGASHIYTETGYLTYRGEKSTPWGTYRRFRVYHNLKVDFNNVWTLMTKTLIQAAEARGYRIRCHRNGPKAAWIPTILMAFPLALTACATAPSPSPVSSTPASSTMQSSTSVTSTSNSPTAPAPEGETSVQGPGAQDAAWGQETAPKQKNNSSSTQPTFVSCWENGYAQLSDMSVVEWPDCALPEDQASKLGPGPNPATIPYAEGGTCPAYLCGYGHDENGNPRPSNTEIQGWWGECIAENAAEYCRANDPYQ